MLAGGSLELEVVLEVCDMVSAGVCRLVGASGDSLHHLQFENLVSAIVELAVQNLESCMFAISIVCQS